MVLSFREEKREIRRKKIRSMGSEKRKEEKNFIVWEVKRVNKYFFPFLGSEKRKIKCFPSIQELKREKKICHFPVIFR